MQLSKRLEAVAAMVTEGNRLADIGCDHAHTSIYLAERGIIPSGIAMDINKGPLERAKENICRCGFSGQIETRLSDGAKELLPGEVDTILISGMGGGLTVKILSESRKVVETVKELVLQPQSEIGNVRHYIHELGFRIVEEFMLTEDGKHYTGIRAVKGQECYDKEIFYRFGKLLLEQKNPVLKEFLEYGKESFTKVTKELSGQAHDRNKERLSELLQELEYMEAALAYYT
ncbi:MAG: tRNA (adenine(22)-N(1))-methyltransferase [Acetivibrio ethanolgignens]